MDCKIILVQINRESGLTVMEHEYSDLLNAVSSASIANNDLLNVGYGPEWSVWIRRGNLEYKLDIESERLVA